MDVLGNSDICNSLLVVGWEYVRSFRQVSYISGHVGGKARAQVMGRTKRGVRDGSGPFAGSYRKSGGKSVGRRRAAGQRCPKRK